MAESPVVTVECRSHFKGEENPVAVWVAPRRNRAGVAGQRLAVTAVRDDAVIGSATAGMPTCRGVSVELENGETWRLLRTLPRGEWRTRRLAASPNRPTALPRP